MTRVWRPAVFQLWLYRSVRGRKLDLVSLIVFWATPSMMIRASPRVGPTGPYHSTRRPVNAIDAVSPAFVA